MIPCSCLCCLMDVRLVNALPVSFCCVLAVICACDYKLVVTCWIFWQVVRCNQLFFANVPYAFAHYPCEADIASCVLHQILLQMMCANIFAGLLCAGHICRWHNIYWLFSQVPSNIQTDITRERVAFQHRGIQSQQGAYIQLQLALTYILQGAWCATLPDHRSTWLHIYWQGDTVNIALWLLVLLLDA